MTIWAGSDQDTIATWTVAGEPTDPTTVTLKFQTGPGASTVWTFGGAGSIVRVSPGVYSARIPVSAGDGIVEWIGTGAAAAVNVEFFQVGALPL